MNKTQLFKLIEKNSAKIEESSKNGIIAHQVEVDDLVDDLFAYCKVKPQLIYNGEAKGYSLTKGEKYLLLWCDKDYYQTINDNLEKQKYAREYFEVLDVN